MFFEFVEDLLVRSQILAHFDKSIYNGDAYMYCPFTFKHTGKHYDLVLGKSIRQLSFTAPT